MIEIRRWLLCVACLFASASALAAAPVISPATTPGQAGLVDITTLAPDIELDIRYVGSNNFVGKPVRGYNAAKCLLLTPVAEALAKVEAELRQQGHGLRIYDCYRPARAVRHFVEWSEDLQDQQTKARHYPNLDKRDLMGEYISATSGHSRGATLDLTLLQCTQGTCEPLDMGTDFDLFDASANTDSPLVTEAQHANRQHLLQAMARHGFRNYPMEWWHYTFQPEPDAQTAYDVPVE